MLVKEANEIGGMKLNFQRENKKDIKYKSKTHSQKEENKIEVN